MPGRNRTSRQHEIRGFREAPYPPPPSRGGGGPVPAPAPAPAYPIEEEIAVRREECRRLLADNRLLLEDIAFLKRENSIVREKRLLISESVPQLRAAKESESREWIQKVLKLEGELRSLEPVRSDAMRLQADLQRAKASKEEIAAKIKELTGNLKHLKSENEKKVADIKADIEAQRQELARTRTELEYEKKAGAELENQVQVMHQSLVGMARECEQLRAELVRRTRGPDYELFGPPRVEMGFPEMYGMNYGPDRDYGGGPRPSPYDPPGRLPPR